MVLRRRFAGRGDFMIGGWRKLQLACLSLCIGALPCWAESEAVSQWKQQIVAQLLLHQQFPIEACGKDGQATVAFRIDRTGKLMSSNIASGAGFPALDKAALEMVRNAQPFPPAPPDVADADLKLVAPINFAKADRPISCEAAIRREEKIQSVMHSICRGC
jgi:TonB family protein